MTILRNPNNIVICQCCNAVLQFNWNEVIDCGGSGGKHYVKQYKAIECPCCKSKVKVWENKKNE